MRHQTRQMLPIFGAVALFTLASTVLVYAMGLRVTWANAAYFDAHETISDLEELLSTLKDAETGQRGFLLVGEEPYLEPYRSALARVEEDLARLERRSKAGQLDPLRARAIHSAVDERLAELDAVIRIRREQGLERALERLRLGIGKGLMDDVRARTGQAAERKKEDLREAGERRDRSSLLRTLVSIAVALVNFAFMAWAFRRIMKEVDDTERQRQLLSVTLASIGDGVIVTDGKGRVAFMNDEAQRLTGWKNEDARNLPLADIFRIVNEYSREPVENPVDKVLRLGTVVGLANHTILISKDGREIPIDDSGAPIREGGGTIQGVVLVFRDFSEHKESEEALRTSEERARLATESAEQGTWDINPVTGTLIWSDRCKAIYGVPLDSRVSYEDFLDRIHPEDRAEAERVVAQALDPAGDGSYRAEYRVRWPDGTQRWVLAAGKAFFGNVLGERRAVRFIGTTLDITERKSAEETLHRYELLASNSRDIILFMTRNDGKILEANVAAEQAYGYTRQELLSMRILDLRAEEHDGLTLAQMREADEHGILFQTTHRRRDGSTFPVEVSSRGATVGGCRTLISMVRDITERKRAQEALQESEERLRLALIAADAGVWEWDLDTGEVIWSPENFDLYGLTFREGALGYGDWERNLHPDDLAAVNGAIGDVVDGRSAEYRAEFRVLHPSRGVRWLLGLGRVDRDGSGRPLRMSGLNIDITERKRVEEELKAAKISAEQAKATAEQADRAKDQFLAVLSHELRTPLTPVLAAVSLLQRELHADSPTLDTLDVIRRNVEMEARLIDDLLDLTRIARGKVELNKWPVELCAIVHHAAEVCMPDIKARGLDFAFDVAGGTYWIDGDAGRLQQVFWNLLKNAVKFTPAGGSVRVRCRPDGPHHVAAEVSDSGDGIAPEVLPRLFTAFEQGDRDTTRRFGGLGLGLAISKSLVELHGGTIEAYSEGKGKGAVFRVRLPLATHVASLQTGAPGGALGTDEGTAEGTGLRLLLVEDHADTAELMRSLLEFEGHRVQTAGTVAAALDLAERDAFDVLISDLGLPDGSGLELMRRLRDSGKHWPGIALSGYGQEQDVQQSRAAGFDAHVVKPVSIEQLLEVVVRVAARQG